MTSPTNPTNGSRFLLSKLLMIMQIVVARLHLRAALIY